MSQHRIQKTYQYEPHHKLGVILGGPKGYMKRDPDQHVAPY